MAILQIYQAKVLKDLHEGVPGPDLLQELRSATDYAFRAAKVTTQVLGMAMSTMVVQERHLWLNLVEMQDAENVRFLNTPISQRAANASPALPRQQPPPAPCWGDTLTGSHKIDSPGKTASGPRGFLPPAKGRFSSQNFLHSRHRSFLRFAFKGRAYQYKVLPFGLSLSSRIFTKVAEVALAPVRKGCGSQPPRLFGTSSQLGKEQTLPNAGYLFSWCGAGLCQYECTSFPRLLSAEVRESTQMQNSVSPETFSEAPGAHGILSCIHAAGPDAHETATALASYPSPEMGTYRVNITQLCRKTFSPWGDISFLRSEVPLKQVSRRIVFTTDAFKTGWGACATGLFNRHLQSLGYT
ncbi:ATP phosphoribosyltransferase [Labeo rohita]|uniref:ATP phosphoribosyltransferase n=1 Tax=Labeo rohita TaxID=84645 RepID=A0ABQ8LHK7_LABRO|nr:ATP phosphoribosyltransferase [Labeo rohita]